MSLFACNYFFNCFSNYSFVEVFSLIFGKSAAKNVGKETAEKPFNLIGNLKLWEVVKYKDSCRVAKKFNSTTRRIHNTRCVHDIILLLQLFVIQPEWDTPSMNIRSRQSPKTGHPNPIHNKTIEILIPLIKTVLSCTSLLPLLSSLPSKYTLLNPILVLPNLMNPMKSSNSLQFKGESFYWEHIVHEIMRRRSSNNNSRRKRTTTWGTQKSVFSLLNPSIRNLISRIKAASCR